MVIQPAENVPGLPFLKVFFLWEITYDFIIQWFELIFVLVV